MPVDFFFNVPEIERLPKELIDLFDEYSNQKIEDFIRSCAGRSFHSRNEAERYGAKVSKLILSKIKVSLSSNFIFAFVNFLLSTKSSKTSNPRT